jgi:predicted acetyltransferase
VAEEYPTVFNLQNLHNLRIIKDKTSEEILSHAVIKPTIIKTRRGFFKVGCIGSVVTSEKHRNQGLSKDVIQNCLDEITAQGCDFALLWSNLFEFYSRMGFTLAGSELSFLIDKPFALNKEKIKNTYNILQENRVDPQALYRLYSQHSVTTLSATTFVYK